MEKNTHKWFEKWFDSKYYHLLYSNRNTNEAAFFIDHLFNKIAPSISANSKILDIACGKGRHALHVNSFGYNVTGIDLSEASIKFAKKFENEDLKFFVHDMRNIFKENSFDICLNLFTSFGYFLNDTENQQAITAMAKNLKKNGLLILDYLNVLKALENLPEEEVKTIEGINFYIKKEVSNGYIRKTISFTADGENHQYYEFVKVITKENFNQYFINAGLKIKETYGDYQLNSFENNESERLIFIAEKV